MNTYQLLTGQSIELGRLCPDNVIRIYELITKAFPDGYKSRGNPISAPQFLREAHDLLHKQLPDPTDYKEAMRGPEGAVFRDLFYRLRATEFNGEDKQKFLDRILYSPLRPILDRYLEGRWSRNEFASATGLERDEIRRLLNQLLEKNSDEGNVSLAMDQVERVYRRLDIRPVANGTGMAEKANVENSPLVFAQQEIKIRERQMYRLAAIAATKLQRGESEKDVQDFLAGNLEALYGFNFVDRAQRIADAMVSDIQLASNSIASNELGDFFRFVSGVARADGTLVTLDLKGDLKDGPEWTEQMSQKFGPLREELVSMRNTVSEAFKPGP